MTYLGVLELQTIFPLRFGHEDDGYEGYLAEGGAGGVDDDDNEDDDDDDGGGDDTMKMTVTVMTTVQGATMTAKMLREYPKQRALTAGRTEVEVGGSIRHVLTSPFPTEEIQSLKFKTGSPGPR